MCETGIVEVPLHQDVQPVESPAGSVPSEQSHAAPDSSSKEASAAEPVEDPAKATGGEDEQEYLRKLPPEIGTLLVMVGIAGLLLPGVIGTPLIIAGAVVIWPKTFEPLERRFAKNYPESHRQGIRQVKRFINDLNRRFPESTS